MISGEAQKASYCLTGTALALFREDNTKGTILGPSPLAGGALSACLSLGTPKRGVSKNAIGARTLAIIRGMQDSGENSSDGHRSEGGRDFQVCSQCSRDKDINVLFIFDLVSDFFLFISTQSQTFKTSRQLQLFKQTPPNNQHAFHHHPDPGPQDLHQLQRLLRCHVNDIQGTPGAGGRA